MREGAGGGDGFGDDEVRAFVDDAPRGLGYAELAARAAARFGPGRAWPAEKVRRYWLTRRARHRGREPSVDADPAVRAFVRDHAGRLTIDGLRAACVERFGEAAAPSRAALGRYVLRMRREALRGP